MRVFFDRELDTVATFWRVFRRDGITLGFTSHDRPLIFGGITHRAAPGMAPAAIRMTSDLTEDSAGVEGALSHDSIRASDLAAGLFDNAAILVGVVDWETLENCVLYSGTLGQIEDNTFGFTAELHSAKRMLEADFVPRTSPTCRAAFCGRGCNLSAVRYTRRTALNAINFDLNQVGIASVSADIHVDGQLRFLDGPQTGMTFSIIGAAGGWLTLDRPLDPETVPGTPVELREGCDHTIETCASRFDNARNFRGEPFMPGNDLLARYGQAGG